MDKELMDLVLKIMVAFTSRTEQDEFVSGLSKEQYATLRNLNVMRIDCGDERTPEDYTLDEQGELSPSNYQVDVQMRTDEEYVEYSAHCPNCGSQDIEAGSISGLGTQASCEVQCWECGLKWKDIFVLAGYECATHEYEGRKDVGTEG